MKNYLLSYTICAFCMNIELILQVRGLHRESEKPEGGLPALGSGV